MVKLVGTISSSIKFVLTYSGNYFEGVICRCKNFIKKGYFKLSLQLIAAPFMSEVRLYYQLFGAWVFGLTVVMIVTKCNYMSW